jgi:hypothetical protein
MIVGASILWAYLKSLGEIIDGLIELTFFLIGNPPIDVELSILRLILFLLSGGIGEQKEENYWQDYPYRFIHSIFHRSNQKAELIPALAF